MLDVVIRDKNLLGVVIRDTFFFDVSRYLLLEFLKSLNVGSGGIIPIPSGSGAGSRTLLGRDRDRDPEHCLDGIGIGTGLVCLE